MFSSNLKNADKSQVNEQGWLFLPWESQLLFWFVVQFWLEIYEGWSLYPRGNEEFDNAAKTIEKTQQI